MSNTHGHITDRLSDYIDGELAPAERAAIEDHLPGCDDCRAVLEDLRRLVEAARRLPDAPPDRELWDGIAQRVASGAVVAAFEPRARRRFSFTAPQLVAAGLMLMLLSGAVVYLARPQGPPAGSSVADTEMPRRDEVALASLADPQYDGAVADLERTLEQGRGQLDPQTVRVLEENLKAIDTAIDQSRRALEADPANAFLNNHLVSARQRKLALLRRATALTTGS
jgi:hypothetical protein